MKNNIKDILDGQGLSILAFSEMMEQHYPSIYKLVNRETLDTTSLGTLDKVARTLDLEIEDLYGNKEW